MLLTARASVILGGELECLLHWRELSGMDDIHTQNRQIKLGGEMEMIGPQNKE